MFYIQDHEFSCCCRCVYLRPACYIPWRWTVEQHCYESWRIVHPHCHCITAILWCCPRSSIVVVGVLAVSAFTDSNIIRMMCCCLLHFLVLYSCFLSSTITPVALLFVFLEVLSFSSLFDNFLRQRIMPQNVPRLLGPRFVFVVTLRMRARSFLVCVGSHSFCPILCSVLHDACYCGRLAKSAWPVF